MAYTASPASCAMCLISCGENISSLLVTFASSEGVAVKKLTSRGQFPFHRRSRTVSVFFFPRVLCYLSKQGYSLFARFFEKLTVFAKTERIYPNGP